MIPSISQQDLKIEKRNKAIAWALIGVATIVLFLFFAFASIAILLLAGFVWLIAAYAAIAIAAALFINGLARL